MCWIGLAWFATEHRAYGWDLPPVAQRYALLEDALQALPVLWGPGGRPFRGRVLDLPDTAAYPRPLQEHVPIVLGGGGEKRTLRLAARYADVLGDVAIVAAVLREHCAETERVVELSHLTTALVGTDATDVDALVEHLRPRGSDPARFAAAVHAGTVDDHVGRFRELADAGVAEVAVRLPGRTDPAPPARMAPVITAFR